MNGDSAGQTVNTNTVTSVTSTTSPPNHTTSPPMDTTVPTNGVSDSHRTNGVVSDSSLSPPSSPAVGKSSEEKLWDALFERMDSTYINARDRLLEHGIGEGDEDSESEEGQLWRMVQGDSPYILEHV